MLNSIRIRFTIFTKTASASLSIAILDYRLPQYSFYPFNAFIHQSFDFVVAYPILITSRVAHAYLWFYVFMHTETAYKMPDSQSYTRLMPNIVFI